MMHPTDRAGLLLLVAGGAAAALAGRRGAGGQRTPSAAQYAEIEQLWPTEPAQTFARWVLEQMDEMPDLHEPEEYAATWAAIRGGDAEQLWQVGTDFWLDPYNLWEEGWTPPTATGWAPTTWKHPEDT